MTIKHVCIGIVTTAAALSGCGGGSAAAGVDFSLGSSTTTSTLADISPQGVYEGIASNGRYFNTLVLENDRYYIIYGNLFENVFNVTGLITGTGQSGNGNFSSADLKDFPAGGIPLAGTLSASFTPGVSLTGVVSRSGLALTFAGTAITNTRYIYAAPARLADIAGTWSLSALGGAPVSLEIAANGTFAASSDGCAFTGGVAPRASGKNVFDVTINFGPAPCVQANQTATGHAVTYLLGNGKRQLIAAATNAARTTATVLAGVR